VSGVRLGLNLGYQTGSTTPAEQLALAREADRLGYAVVWAAEAYGSDSPSVLAWLAGQTERIDLGSAVMQIPARTPAATAMTAATLDAVSGGRFRLGLGVSGPQVSEGWHGVRFGQPLARTREYVEIVRMALARQRLAYDGSHYRLPLPDGPGKALKLGFHPPRSRIPVYLAAIGPRNLRLAGEIADGWLAIFLSPEHAAGQLAEVRAGRRLVRGRSAVNPYGTGDTTGGDGLGDGGDLAGFDVAASVPVVVGDDPAWCAEPVRWYAALYVGGMGSREQNFYHALAVRMGYGQAARTVQDEYLAGHYRDAAAAVPFAFIDQTSLLGSRERIADRLRAYADAGVTTLSVTPFGGGVEVLRTVAEAAELAGIGG
jgi:F420-dependent oxidoreductase-like protein